MLKTAFSENFIISFLIQLLNCVKYLTFSKTLLWLLALCLVHPISVFDLTYLILNSSSVNTTYEVSVGKVTVTVLCRISWSSPFVTSLLRS